MNSQISTLPGRLPTKLSFAAAAIVLALFAMPHPTRAQGIIGGAQEGSREGNRAAGPVGGVVGGAIGAGVGGAVGGVKGVLGIPDRGYRRGHRCHGYYTRRGNYRCYR
jgi:phage tail tape-measure protein